MKKGTKIFLAVIASIIAFVLAVIIVNSIRYSVTYNKNIKNYDSEIIVPSYDFVQPWLVIDWEVEDWEEHIDTLKSVGYTGIIFQYSRYTNTFYYEEDGMDSLISTDIEIASTTMMENMFKACDNKDFKVFVGLSVDGEWWDFKKYADEEYLDKQSKIDNEMVDSLIALYGNHESFYGWYWAHELLTNIHGYEIKWAKMINILFAHLEEVGDTRPLMFSPFKHELLSGTPNDTYTMWRNFFSLANFRKGDIFAPQDSIGKISDSGINKKALAKTYYFIDACSKAAKTNENIVFYVNCELFATSSVFKEDLHTASFERIIDQYKIASQFASGIITFSYSHYIAPDGPNNTQKDLNEIHNSMIEWYKNN